jgi:hypothetical protein
VDEESAPQRGEDRDLMPADAETGSGSGAPADTPTVVGEALGSSGLASPGGPQSGVPDQPRPPGGFTPAPAPGYQVPASPSGYQAPPGSGGYQAPASPSGYQAPPVSGGYQAPGPPSGYQAPPGSAGYQAPGPPSGYQAPPGSGGYQAPGWPSGFQSPPSPSGYQAGSAPSGFKAPDAPASFHPTVPLPGDLNSAQPTVQQQGGWGTAAPGAGYAGSAPQQGYPGAPPGAAWPGAGTPQPKRRRGLVLTVVAVVAAVIAGGVTGLVLLLDKGESPAAMAMQAGQAIAPAAGVNLSGSFDQAPANLTVTNAGTVTGTYSQEAFSATRFTINGVTYLKAPAGFWALQQGVQSAAASQAGNAWAKTPGSDVTSFAAFTPGQIAHVLEHVSGQPDVVDTTLGHTKVINLTIGGTSYYITTSTPNRLLRIDGSSGGLGYSFNITPLTATTIAPVYTIMRGYVQALQNAQDPEASLTPGNPNLGNDCSTTDTSCTVTESMTVTDSGSATVLLTMTANFSGTKNGTPFGSCNATQPVSTDNSSKSVSVSLTCQLTGQAWQGWVDSQVLATIDTTGTFNTWVQTTVDVEVNSASDVTALQNTLNQQQRG